LEEGLVACKRALGLPPSWGPVSPSQKPSKIDCSFRNLTLSHCRPSLRPSLLLPTSAHTHRGRKNNDIRKKTEKDRQLRHRKDRAIQGGLITSSRRKCGWLRGFGFRGFRLVGGFGSVSLLLTSPNLCSPRARCKSPGTGSSTSRRKYPAFTGLSTSTYRPCGHSFLRGG
jgi:hypothetical protein